VVKLEYNKAFLNMNLKKKNAFIFTCLFLISIIVLASMVVFYISNNIVIVGLGYKIIELENIKVELEEQNRKYELRADTLSALGRIEAIAINQLDMIRPKEVEFIVLNTNANSNELENIGTANLHQKKEDYFWASVNLKEKNSLILGVLK
jgi:cell division protein FtsL